MTKKVSCVMRIVASGLAIKKEFEAKMLIIITVSGASVTGGGLQLIMMKNSRWSWAGDVSDWLML